MSICGSASPWAKVALLLIVIALGLQAAGFGTNYWMQTETIQEDTVVSIGLWKALNCSGGHDAACQDFDVPSTYVTSSYKATQGLECVVMVLVLIVAIIAAFYVASERSREMSVSVAITVLCFFTVTLGVIAMIIWLTQLPSDFYPGFSFGLCVFAFLLIFFAGILMIPDMRNYSKQKANRRSPIPQKVAPASPEHIRHVSKYDEIGYDRTYNKRFMTPESKIRHYHNPNREPYIRSPPPLYSSRGYTPESARLTRSEIHTPDVYLGRDTRRTPRRY